MKFFVACISITLFTLLTIQPIFAQTADNDFQESFFCRTAFLRWLFRPTCPSQNPPPLPTQTSPIQRPGSLQLRSFRPPATPSPTIISPTDGVSTPTQPTLSPLAGGLTEQVDWVFNGEGRCWSAWAENSCNLLSHEGGTGDAARDLNGDGTIDITCSSGSGTNHSTTLTNISNQSLTLRCEQYACNSCKSGNATHAQCDTNIDPSAARQIIEYVVAPGCTATCTMSGVSGSCGPTPTTPQNPPPLPTGINPPIVTSCPLGTGYCSIENLMRYFDSYEKAYKASVICQAESHSNTLAANRACLIGESKDYSIGLFQINLAAHCTDGVRLTSGNYCTVINQSKLNTCLSQYQNPDYNIQKAVALSNNGTDWYPTWGAAGPAYCNVP